MRLSTELANMTNEVARLTVVQQQVGTVEDRIERVGRNCQHSKHTEHSKLVVVIVNHKFYGQQHGADHYFFRN